jgi:DNA polymerase-1
MSGDEFLLQVFRDGRDLHSEVALAMYGPDFTKEQRMLTKMFNFSYLYGGNEHSFAEDAGLPLSIAIEFVRKYNQVMPRLKQWKDDQEATMMANGFIRYRTGACRRFPFIQNSNKDEARKAAYNAPVQGSASHMTSLSAYRALPMVKSYGGNILLLVHDSIVGEAPIPIVEEVALRAKSIMEETASEYFPEVKWVSDAEIGERWSTLHKLS